MEIRTKFNLHEEVWAIYENVAYRKVNCLTCERKGTVLIGGESFRCPKCEGRSQHDAYAGRKWFISDHGKVGQIAVEVTGAEYRCSDFDEGDKWKRQYMLDCTGVGSGTLHEEDNLFASREEAEAAIVDRNANLKHDEVHE